MNMDILSKMKSVGFNLNKINKICHHQTVCDPTHSPKPEFSKTMIEYFLGDVIDHDLNFYEGMGGQLNNF